MPPQKDKILAALDNVTYGGVYAYPLDASGNPNGTGGEITSDIQRVPAMTLSTNGYYAYPLSPFASPTPYVDVVAINPNAAVPTRPALPGLVFSAGATHPTMNVAYLAATTTSLVVRQYLIGATGSLSVTKSGTFSGVTMSPIQMSVTPSGSAVHVTVGDGHDYAFTLAGDGGISVSGTDTIVTGVTDQPRFAFDVKRTAVHFISPMMRTHSVFPLKTDGTLDAKTVSELLTCGTPGNIAIGPSGDYAYVGAGNGKVCQYSIDAAGAFAPLTPPDVSASTVTGVADLLAIPF